MSHFAFWKQATRTLGRGQEKNEPQVRDIIHAAFCNTGTSLHTMLTGQPTAELVHTRTEDAQFSQAPIPGILCLQQDGIICTCSKFLLNSYFKKQFLDNNHGGFCSLQSKMQKEKKLGMFEPNL